MVQKIVAAALFLSAASCQFALAEECTIYISTPFNANGAMDIFEHAFDQMLMKSGFHHDPVQCPRADDERSALEAILHAAKFNQSVGHNVKNIDWRP
jgi:hypothetical protein